MMGFISSLVALALLSATPGGVVDPVARGDAAWARRAEGYRDGVVRPAPIKEAVRAYEEALGARPDDLTVHGKLLQALFFQGEYTVADRVGKKKIFERGRQVFDQSQHLLVREVGGRRRLGKLAPRERAAALAHVEQAAAIYFWGAVHWGLWGENFGRLAAVRRGVAKRIRGYALTALALDETYDNAGPHRLLGRLHALAPKVPFFTGWVDRDTAVAELERAVALAPEDFRNRFFLAEALLEFRPKRRGEALGILADLVARHPHPDRLVEEDTVQAEARALLAKLSD